MSFFFGMLRSDMNYAVMKLTSYATVFCSTNESQISTSPVKSRKESTMKNILLILGSPRDRASYSHQIARRVVDDLKSRYPAAKIVVRNLAREPLPHVTDAFATGRGVSKEKRSLAEARALELSDVLVAELMAADVLVLATPMHNFGVSTSVKAW